MDMMELRFRMMSMIGGSSMVGELSRYQKITVTPSENTQIEIIHTLGVLPKMVIVNGEPDFSGSVAYLSHGIFDQRCGNMLSGSTYVVNAYTVTTGSTSTSNSYAYMTDTTVRIRRTTSARYFDTGCTYTVELYA